MSAYLTRLFRQLCGIRMYRYIYTERIIIGVVNI